MNPAVSKLNGTHDPLWLCPGGRQTDPSVGGALGRAPPEPGPATGSLWHRYP